MEQPARSLARAQGNAATAERLADRAAAELDGAGERAANAGGGERHPDGHQARPPAGQSGMGASDSRAAQPAMHPPPPRPAEGVEEAKSWMKKIRSEKVCKGSCPFFSSIFARKPTFLPSKLLRGSCMQRGSGFKRESFNGAAPTTIQERDGRSTASIRNEAESRSIEPATSN